VTAPSMSPAPSRPDGPDDGFWSDGTWNALTASSAPVEPFDQAGIDKDGANYLLSIGDEVYVSISSGSQNVQKLADNDDFAIYPGQFAFILTAERVAIPFDKIGFISIRASSKFLGLVNISGFHVDPGYRGKLIFAVFNAGPTRIHLRRGDRLFPLWIAALDKPMQRTTWKTGHEHIPSQMISAISGDFTTAYQLADKLKKAEDDIVQLKSFRVYFTALLGVLLILVSPFLKDLAQNAWDTWWPLLRSLLEWVAQIIWKP
jgi:dCTP deaminase